MSRSNGSKPRVLFLNRSYWPDAEATGQLLTELCEDLSGSFDVTVIAGQPNQNPAGLEFVKNGTETRQGVTIHRVLNSRFNKANIVGRGINLVTYLLTSTWRALWIPKQEVVVVETDPPLLCFLGVFLRFWYGAKLVMYLQDVYPDIALKLGKIPGGFLYRVLRWAMHGVYRRADMVITLSEDMRDLLLSARVPAERIEIVPNWVDASAVHPVKVDNGFRRWHAPTGFLVMYSGNLGLSQRLEHFLESANLLRDEPDIRFFLVGDGASKGELEKRTQQLALPNVTFLPYQPKEELATSLSAADLHFVVLDPLIAGCLMPSKIYGVLASGTAMLVATTPGCELARLVENHRVGRVVPFGDPKAIADGILALSRNRSELNEMGARARQLAVEQYDRKCVTQRFGELLTQALSAVEARVSNPSDEE